MRKGYLIIFVIESSSANLISAVVKLGCILVDSFFLKFFLCLTHKGSVISIVTGILHS